MHTFLVGAYKTPDFALSHDNFAHSHDYETVIFRNSRWAEIILGRKHSQKLK